MVIPNRIVAGMLCTWCTCAFEIWIAANFCIASSQLLYYPDQLNPALASILQLKSNEDAKSGQSTAHPFKANGRLIGAQTSVWLQATSQEHQKPTSGSSCERRRQGARLHTQGSGMPLKIAIPTSCPLVQSLPFTHLTSFYNMMGWNGSWIYCVAGVAEHHAWHALSSLFQRPSCCLMLLYCSCTNLSSPFPIHSKAGHLAAITCINLKARSCSHGPPHTVKEFLFPTSLPKFHTSIDIPAVQNGKDVKLSSFQGLLGKPVSFFTSTQPIHCMP